MDLRRATFYSIYWDVKLVIQRGVSKERNVIFGHGLNPLRRISPDRIGWMEALEWTGWERFCEDVLLGWVISVIHGLKITFSLQSQIGPIINEVRHLVTTETKRKITITSVGVMLVPSPTTIHSFLRHYAPASTFKLVLQIQHTRHTCATTTTNSYTWR